MAFLFRWQDWPVQWPFYALAVTAWLYFLGGRASATPGRASKRWRGAAFYGGILALVLAIDSPIDVYAESLFWVHMLQHVLLMLVAPPLLLLGRPWPRVSRPLPIDVRRPLARAVLVGDTLAPVRRAVRRLADPLPSFVVFNATLLAWHVPALYDLTLRYGVVHDLEHALFFGTAMLFWSHLVPGAVARPRLSEGQRVAYATAGMLVSWLLAVVLGLAPDAVYPAYASLGHRPGGISALADQQLAAGMMWVPGSIPYTIAIFVAAFRWLDPAAATRRRIELRPRETS